MRFHDCMPTAARESISKIATEASESEKTFLHRLAESPDLAASDLGPEDWLPFFEAAVIARQDFSRFRETRDRLKRHYKQIAEVAEDLARLIDKVPDVATADVSSFIMSQPENAPEIPGDDELVTILQNLAYIAGNMDLEFGAVGAAIQSRKRTPKTAYLRAFGYHLLNRGIDFTSDVVRAMAEAATIGLDSKDETVSPDDVRKAVETLKRSHSR